ncbi:hypothetical protein Pmani_032374 [Petrolisthes manimaculis]|uniref:Uncharacterized protein n=1 Tax=Petrolisthes manimaculis TaxID=1843537 RepID=A0AAE1TTU8_9EUCA|nr:hypothetical protein Pmani_032374 [Petrolisthes manimaculis]
MPGQIGWDGGEGLDSSQENQQLPSSVSQFLVEGDAGCCNWSFPRSLACQQQVPPVSAARVRQEYSRSSCLSSRSAQVVMTQC